MQAGGGAGDSRGDACFLVRSVDAAGNEALRPGGVLGSTIRCRGEGWECWTSRLRSASSTVTRLEVGG